MNDIALLFAIGIICFSIHWLCHRIDRNRKHSLLRGIIIYSIGGFLLFIFGYEYKVLALILYQITVILFSFLLFHITLEGQTPIDTIFGHFEKHNPSPKKTILSLFDDKTVIDVRLNALVEKNLIYKTNQTYTLTAKGKIMWKNMRILFSFFGLTING